MSLTCVCLRVCVAQTRREVGARLPHARLLRQPALEQYNSHRHWQFHPKQVSQGNRTLAIARLNKKIKQINKRYKKGFYNMQSTAAMPASSAHLQRSAVSQWGNSVTIRRRMQTLLVLAVVICACHASGPVQYFPPDTLLNCMVQNSLGHLPGQEFSLLEDPPVVPFVPGEPGTVYLPQTSG